MEYILYVILGLVSLLVASYYAAQYYFLRIKKQAIALAEQNDWALDTLFIDFGYGQRRFEVLVFGIDGVHVYVASSGLFQKQSLYVFSKKVAYEEVDHILVKATAVNVVLKDQKSLRKQVHLLWSALKPVDGSDAQFIRPVTTRQTQLKIIELSQKNNVAVRTSGITANDIFIIVLVAMWSVPVGALIVIMNL